MINNTQLFWCDGLYTDEHLLGVALETTTRASENGAHLARAGVKRAHSRDEFGRPKNSNGSLDTGTGNNPHSTFPHRSLGGGLAHRPGVMATG